jgi:hypothetical protein
LSGRSREGEESGLPLQAKMSVKLPAAFPH